MEYKIKDIYKEEKYYKIIINDNIIILTTLSQIKKYNLKKHIIISKEIIDDLIRYEKIISCYNHALKILSYKDYNEVKLKNKLLDKSLWEEDIINDVIIILVEKELVNDYDYSVNYIKSYINKGYGYKKAQYNLKRDGVSSLIIEDALLEFNTEDEYNSAYNLANQIYLLNTNKPMKALKLNIKQRLLNRGFSSYTIEKVINDINIHISKDETNTMLINDFNKVYKRYKNKYSGLMLKNKLINFLLNKGYIYEDIVNILERSDDYEN